MLLLKVFLCSRMVVNVMDSVFSTSSSLSPCLFRDSEIAIPSLLTSQAVCRDSQRTAMTHCKRHSTSVADDDHADANDEAAVDIGLE